MPGHAPSTLAAMSAILQTIIGAAAAIVGGFVGAWWQTRRADDVARRIRREERQEQALLALFSKASDVSERLANIRFAAATVPLTSQYEAARQAVSELRELWDTNLMAGIGDLTIATDVWAFYVRSGELLPGGAKAMMQYAEDDTGAKVAHFIDDLSELSGLAARLRDLALAALDSRLPRIRTMPA